MGLMCFIAGLSNTVQAVLNVDPAFQTCTIVLSDGSVAFGNGKNDMCHTFEGVDGAKITDQQNLNSWKAKWNTNEFLCELESGAEMLITKEIFRIDNYSVKAFGYEYFGVKGSDPGITDGLVVKSHSVKEAYDPAVIIFKSSALGVPESVTIHLNGGRAPLYENISCEQIY